MVQDYTRSKWAQIIRGSGGSVLEHNASMLQAACPSCEAACRVDKAFGYFICMACGTCGPPEDIFEGNLDRVLSELSDRTSKFVLGSHAKRTYPYFDPTGERLVYITGLTKETGANKPQFSTLPLFRSKDSAVLMNLKPKQKYESPAPYGASSVLTSQLSTEIYLCHNEIYAEAINKHCKGQAVGIAILDAKGQVTNYDCLHNRVVHLVFPSGKNIDETRMRALGKSIVKSKPSVVLYSCTVRKGEVAFEKDLRTKGFSAIQEIFSDRKRFSLYSDAAAEPNIESLERNGYFQFLGRDPQNSKYYFRLLRDRGKNKIVSSPMTDILGMLQLAPRKGFWGHYEDGIIQLENLADTVNPHFDVKQIRSKGIHEDLIGGDYPYVYNSGSNLITFNNSFRYDHTSVRHTYSGGFSTGYLSPADDQTQVLDRLVNTISQLPLSDGGQHKLTGWLMCSFFAGVLPEIPHLWLQVHRRDDRVLLTDSLVRLLGPYGAEYFHLDTLDLLRDIPARIRGSAIPVISTTDQVNKQDDEGLWRFQRDQRNLAFNPSGYQKVSCVHISPNRSPLDIPDTGFSYLTNQTAMTTRSLEVLYNLISMSGAGIMSEMFRRGPLFMRNIKIVHTHLARNPDRNAVELYLSCGYNTMLNQEISLNTLAT